jgi:hypothetical protein
MKWNTFDKLPGPCLQGLQSRVLAQLQDVAVSWCSLHREEVNQPLARPHLNPPSLSPELAERGVVDLVLVEVAKLDIGDSNVGTV